MSQHTRLKNQVMSAKVRKITSVSLSTGEADAIEAEWNAAHKLIETLTTENKAYQAKLKERSANAQAQSSAASPKENTVNSILSKDNSVLDGGKF
jgi:hypothetical protein